MTKTNILTLLDSQEQSVTSNQISPLITHRTVQQTAILACVTMYNEDGIELVKTLAGLARNVENLRWRYGKSETLNLTVCVIVDGQIKLSPSAVYWVEQLGLLNNKIEPQDSIGNSLKIYQTELSTTNVLNIATQAAKELNISVEDLLMLRHIEKDKTKDKTVSGPLLPNNFEETAQPKDASFSVLFCLKEENAGKLDTHWWFFNHLCPAYTPKYCLQIDVGTVPKSDAIGHLWSTLEEDSQCAAAASSILVSPPSSPWHLLHLWQYVYFVWSKTIEWPLQSLGGYLEVIPGQFSIIRWSAFSYGTQSNHPHAESPLNFYFRGMKALPPFEANMFLAEDRVLAFQLIAQPKSDWTIRYVHSAIAITDKCKSLCELLRQRRRWINSGETAKLWAIRHLNWYWQNSSSSGNTKLSILSAIVWIMLSFFTSWFIPALYFLQLICLQAWNNATFTQDLLSHSIAQSLLITSGTLWVVQLILCLIRQIDSWSERLLILIMWLQVLIFLSFIIAIPIFTPPYLIELPIFFVSLMIFQIGFWLIVIGLFSKPVFKQMAPIAFLHQLIAIIVENLLVSYAIANLHDCSWGTKGLHRPKHKVEESNSGRINFLWFRNYALVTWLLTNSAVVMGLLLLNDVTLFYLAAVLNLIFVARIIFGACCGLLLFVK